MKLAIDEAMTGILSKEGGPFGSVIVKDGKVVGKGHNQVVANNDATCHGEIQAIRDASKNLGTFDLSGCVIYTTGEPCPMCLTACMWANIEKVYYGCTLDDNSLIGFRDKKFDTLLGGRENLKNYAECIDRAECLALFEKYNALADKTPY
ncbi:MAG: nucleoside deaminase [Bacteroides sp.]|nr:nucleoside deaminase [Bacillota bacterium]MCM1393631.1 nucleoside deaminase [[Eubacterium] siraeum]MCM1454977.1 nucleoside deaminase [Bacteroides sp.]